MLVTSNSCDPGDCSPPGSSVHGISQATTLEWAAIPYPGESSWTRDQAWVSCTADTLYHLSRQGSPYTVEHSSYTEFRHLLCKHWVEGYKHFQGSRRTPTWCQIKGKTEPAWCVNYFCFWSCKPSTWGLTRFWKVHALTFSTVNHSSQGTSSCDRNSMLPNISGL